MDGSGDCAGFLSPLLIGSKFIFMVYKKNGCNLFSVLLSGFFSKFNAPSLIGNPEKKKKDESEVQQMLRMRIVVSSSCRLTPSCSFRQASTSSAAKKPNPFDGPEGSYKGRYLLAKIHTKKCLHGYFGVQCRKCGPKPISIFLLYSILGLPVLYILDMNRTRTL